MCNVHTPSLGLTAGAQRRNTRYRVKYSNVCPSRKARLRRKFRAKFSAKRVCPLAVGAFDISQRRDLPKFLSRRPDTSLCTRTRSGKSRRRRRGHAQHPVPRVHTCARARARAHASEYTQNNADSHRHILFIEQRASWRNGE